MKKIELYFGQGQASVLIDWKKRNCALYNGTPEFHKEYGGCTYYVSRSGLSCAGWIPNKPYLQKALTYRTDASNEQDVLSSNNSMFFAPFDYRKGCIDGEYPVVYPMFSSVDEKLPEQVALLSPAFLDDPKRMSTTEEYSIEFRYVRPTQDTPMNRVWKVDVRSQRWFARYKVKKVLLRLFQQRMYPSWKDSYNPFWDSLGIRLEQNAYGQVNAFRLGGYGIPIDWKHVERGVLNGSALSIFEYLGWKDTDCEFVDQNTIALTTPNGFTLFRRKRLNNVEMYFTLSPYETVEHRFWFDEAYRKEVLNKLE